MKRLFPLPLYAFIKMVYKNGGISLKGLRNVPAWMTKLILFEPLRWIELTYNKRIEQHSLTKDPVFVLGFYRSGTSFLHEFLSQDDRFGYHTNFQMILPDIMLGSEKVLVPFLNTICRIFNLQDPVHRIQMSFRYPGEEDGAMTTSLNPRGSALGWFFPKVMMEQFHKYVLFENIQESEMEGWKEDFIFLLKKVSLASKGKQLILKSPPHTARIKMLLSLFPNAKFIFIHRNPYDVYASNKRFWKVTNRIYALGSTRSVDFNNIILDTYAKIMQQYLLEKDLIPEGNLIEVPYQEFIKRPMEYMENIYETLQLNDFSYCKPIMQKYIEGQKTFIRLKHELPPEERLMVTQKLEPFLRHWNYPIL